MKEYAFKPVDHSGEETLNNILLADHFNRWMYDTIKPWCNGEILEIGSGIGNISGFFVHDGASIFLSDIRENYCNTLKNNFKESGNILDIETIDLADPDFDRKQAGLFNRFDTVFALNVVEHIRDDRQAMENCRKMLKPGGRAVILVPAYQWLFNDFDRELEHYRRYTKKTLGTLFNRSGFDIVHKQYFNAAAIAGWFVSGKLQHHRIIPASQMKLFNRLVGLFKLLDRIILNSFGISVIMVGEKKREGVRT
jgi:2-polyprenyl-3-methyl-5-hydroxy-6-metoxy-1,4-benzoquinol methylase